MTDKKLADEFFQLFLGLERAYGQYKIPASSKGKKGKIKGAAKTVLKPLTLPHWEDHLAGGVGIGVIPINDEAEVNFGAIDIDEDNVDLKQLEREVSAMELPLIVCRSKSGGAHLYLFTSEPVSAQVVRGKLGEWAVALGKSGVEVFPKQIELASNQDIGNWINMPYFDHKNTNRYAVVQGKKLTASKFIEVAKALALDEEELIHTSPPEDASIAEWFLEAPPCIQSLARSGIPKGNRNNGLFAIAVYLRKRFGDSDWEQRLDEYNQEFLQPPLGHKEVMDIVRNLKKKSYEYKCNEPPLANVCNKQICVTREFGVGQGDNDPGIVIGGLTKICTEPVMWVMDIDGRRMELSTDELKSQAKFHSRCIEVLNKWPNMIKNNLWVKLIREKLSNAEIIEMPEDAKAEGQLWRLLEKYLTERPPARTREELLQDKPWTDKGITYFSALHFKTYLEGQRFRIRDRELWAWLKERGTGQHKFNIKGNFRNFRTVKEFKGIDSEFDVPSLEEIGEM